MGQTVSGKVLAFSERVGQCASTYSFHALERPREVWSAWRFSSFIGDELKDESEASDGYQAGNVNDEALHVTGWHGSGDKISFCLQDWEMAKVALSCRSRMALDILSQEMYEVERRRGWFGLWARLVLQKGKEVNDTFFWVELAGLFPSKFWYNFRNMVCLRNEGVPSLLLCRLVCVSSLEGWKEEVYLLLKMWWPHSEDWFPDFRCVHEGRESWASHGWSLSVVSQSQTFQHWWGVTFSIRSHVDCVLNHGKIIKIHLIMQFEFQQSKSCLSVKVPPDSVHRQSADLPVVLQRRVPTVHPVHKTAEIRAVLGWRPCGRAATSSSSSQWRRRCLSFHDDFEACLSGLLCSIFLKFSYSAHLDVESWLSVEFLGSPRGPTVVGHRGPMPICS